MVFEPRSSRSLLQRRSSVSNAIQAGLDGIAVTGIAWYLIYDQFGYITSDYVIMLLLLIGALAVIYDHYAIYRTNVGLSIKAFRLFKAWSATFCFLVVMAFLTKQSETYSRLLVVQLFVIGYVAQLFLHFAVRELQKRFSAHSRLDNALIIGNGDLANFLYQKISNNPWFGERVLGCVLLDKGDGQGLESAEGKQRLPVLGHIGDLDELVAQHGIRTVYLVTPLGGSEVINDVYFKLLDKCIAVNWVPDIFSLRLINHSVREIAGIPVLTLSETPLIGMRLFLKNLEDKVLTSLILLMAAPVLALVALAIKLDSPGPVFFRQRRHGFNHETIVVWKFRTMRHEPAGPGLQITVGADRRITRVGGFLRASKLDELPQLLDVWLGDMSLVGPRPCTETEYENYLPWQKQRFATQPGLTGLWQVSGKNKLTFEQMIGLDLQYIARMNFWLDVAIMLATVPAMLLQYAESRATLKSVK